MSPVTDLFLRCVLVVLITPVLWSTTARGGQDEEAIETIIKEAATAAATFSETGDRQAVLKLYTDDYQGTQDGESETKAAIEKWLGEYESELKKGSRLRFISAVTNLKAGLSGAFGWATYDYVFQAVRQGELEGQDTGKCTTLLRKEASSWVIFHEHCSKTRTGELK